VIYLDNNASTRVDAQVLEAMLPWFRECWANPSSTRHSEGLQALDAINASRRQVAVFLHCHPSEIVFTSGASESNTLAIECVRLKTRPPRVIVTSNVEHHSSQAAALRLGDSRSTTTVLQVGRSGTLSHEDLARVDIDDETLVTLQWVNNETGVINEIEKIAPLVKERGGCLHVDAVQAIGKIPVDLSVCPIDLLTISSHKIHGPKGVGALFVRRGIDIVPLIRGGAQEHGQRAGTENVPGIVGLGKAIELMATQEFEAAERVKILRDRLESGLTQRCPRTVILAKDAPRVGNTSFVGWPGLDNREILRSLDAKGICAGAGSACTEESAAGSHVLSAMSVDEELMRSVIRFSLSRETTLEEIDTVVSAMEKIIKEQYDFRD
jgi:cysteine desulfurase